MKDSWLCRDYQAGDEHQILSLYRQVTGREMSLDFWKWKYAWGPFGKGIIKLMFDRDKLIGHYAVIPMNIQVRDVPARAVFSLNTITHPDYQRQGIFIYLAEEAYKKCEQLGFKFVYGFPNENSYYGFTHKLGWKGLGKMSILYKELRGEAVFPSLSKQDNQIYQVEKFGDDIDLLWHKVKEDYNIIVPRTKEFLNWRYVEHPKVNYAKYIAKGSSGEPAGYVVLKVFRAENETRGHIVDILSLESKDIVRGLVRSACDYFIEKGISSVSCWMQDNCSYADALKEEGFVRQEMVKPYPYFGVKVFGQVDPLAGSVEHVENWYLTMGDSDVF